MRLNRTTIVTMLALAILMACVPAAMATVEVRITDGTGTNLYIGSPTLSGSAVVAIQTDADFVVDIQVGTSNAPAGPAKLTLSGSVETAPGVSLPQDLTVEVSDVGFMLPSGPAALIQTVNTNTPAALSATGTLAATGYYGTGAGNIFFCQATAACSASTPGASFGSFLVTNPGQIDTTGVSFVTPFSLDQVVKYHFTGAGSALITSTLSAVVPEPASVTLLGGLLLLSVGVIRRRAKRT